MKAYMQVSAEDREAFVDAARQGQLSVLSSILGKLHAAGEGSGDASHTAQLLLNRAFIKQRQQQHQAALKYYDKALQLDPALLKARLRRAQLLTEMGSAEAAAQGVAAAEALVGPASDLEVVLELQALRARLAGEGGQAPAAATREANPEATQAAVGQAVGFINSGQLKEAAALMDAVLELSPRHLGALVARGSARALMGHLPSAISDLTTAIQAEPRFADAWRRRGQARAAAGDLPGALSDLRECMRLLPLLGAPPAEQQQRTAELQAEMAGVQHRLGEYSGAVALLDQALVHLPQAAQSWHLLGVCHAVMGHIREALAAYNTTLALDPGNPDVWLNLARALTGAGRMDEAEAALARCTQLDNAGRPVDGRSASAVLLRAQLAFSQGLHTAAVPHALSAASALDPGPSIEALLLAATSLHTLGKYQEALAAYDSCLSRPAEAGNRDQSVYQLLCWYQRATALYAQAVQEAPAASSSLDCQLPADLREAWCKKATPTPAMLAALSLPAAPSAAPGPALDLQALAPLTSLADELGALLQYTHQGFHRNRRQMRAAGYAAIELAQALQGVLAARRAGGSVLLDNPGASGLCGQAGQHEFGWRDAMDLVVKWRQLAEPGDAVLWVDQLPASSFREGFGSHTRMLGGQGEDIRYHMNAGRALALHKQLLLAQPHSGHDAAEEALVLGEQERAAIAAAGSVEELWEAIGEDSWALVPLASVYRPGAVLQGTRLTLVRQAPGFEYSIRTPNTPARWAEFEEELALAWREVLAALEGGEVARTADAVLAFGYFWYNLMPLARGTAGAGYAALVALFHTGGHQMRASIPRNYQVDWEAILAPTFGEFRGSMSAWLLPGLVANSGMGWDELPAVSRVLGSARLRIEALNSLED